MLVGDNLLRIRAFCALQPRPEWAARVTSVPYDAVDREEALRLAENNPYSFLHVVRPEIDLPPSCRADDAAVYAKALENYRRIGQADVMRRDPSPAVYVYRMTDGGHSQSGVAACCRIADLEDQTIRRHEATRLERERDRANLIRRLRAQPGPVFLTYRDNAEIDRRVGDVETRAPECDFVSEDGVRHTVWRAEESDGLVAAFESVPAGYVADGHHRAAAAAAVGRQLGALRDERHPAAWFSAILFPCGQVRIRPYNRCVRDLNGLTCEAFVERVAQRFDVRAARSMAPSAPRSARMCAGGKWYALDWTTGETDGDVKNLDVQVLHDRLLAPVLGIRDPRTDPRILFLGGRNSVERMVAEIAGGRAQAGFSLFPLRVEEMLAVADQGGMMPPKSTWFEPKPRSGLLVYTF